MGELLLGEAQRKGVQAREIHDEHGHDLTEEDALIEALLEQEVITPSAIKEETRPFYDTHEDRFCSEPLVEAENIPISASPDDNIAYNMALSDARALISELSAKPRNFWRLPRQTRPAPCASRAAISVRSGPVRLSPNSKRRYCPILKLRV